MHRGLDIWKKCPRAAFRAFLLNEEGPLIPANLQIPPAKSRLGFLGIVTPMRLGGEHSGVSPEFYKIKIIIMRIHIKVHH